MTLPQPVNTAIQPLKNITDGISITPFSDFSAPGNIAVWILIFAELIEFGFFFLVFLIAKILNPDIFFQGVAQLNTIAGMLNTFILLTSSYFIANAIKSIKSAKRERCLFFLYLTLLCGAIYCGIKAWEYQWNLSQNITSRDNLFFSLYYYLTFNHWLHVAMGMCVISWVTVKLHFNFYNENDYEGLESAASYWHMIDLVWIIIFPLLYVLR